MKVTLLSEKLQFISLGTGTIHTRDLATITMCGQKIPTSFSPRVERSLPTERLCKRCLASLRTYTDRPARRLLTNAPVAVRFEESEAAR